MASSITDTLPAFALPAIKVEPMQGAAAEDRYLVVLQDSSRHLIVSKKLANLILMLQEGQSLEEVARRFSLTYNREVSADDISLIIEHQMVPKGLASRTGGERVEPRVQVPKRSLASRLLRGTFRWRLLKPTAVKKICAPLTPLYDTLSVLLAVLLIVVTRWSLYSNMDWVYYRQSLLHFSSYEYLLNLSLLIGIILAHEFGHAAAQIRMGLPPGLIGFQLYYYIPSLYANVDGSWRLPPLRRVVVDVGGIYFQCVAASLLYLINLKVQSTALLSTILTSDILTVVAINPFLKFDGYWLLADLLAVPNLEKESKKLLATYRRRIFGQKAAGSALMPLNWLRRVTLTAYAVFKRLFMAWLIYALLRSAPRLLASASSIIGRMLADFSGGIKTASPTVAFASILRLGLFTLLMLTFSMFLLQMLVDLWGLCRRVIRNHMSARRSPGQQQA